MLVEKEYEYKRIAWINKALILIGYCIPFAYLAVNGDASYER